MKKFLRQLVRNADYTPVAQLFHLHVMYYLQPTCHITPGEPKNRKFGNNSHQC